HQREGAWTVFADLALVEGAGEGGVLPGPGLEADPGGGRITVLPVGVLLRGHQAQGVIDLVGGMDLHTGREVHALVLVAEAEIGLHAQLQPVIQETPGDAEHHLLRLRNLAAGALVVRPLQATAGRPLVLAILDLCLRRVAHGATLQVLLAVELAVQGESRTHAELALDAGLEHARLVAALLAQAESEALAARIGEEIQLLATMLPLQQPGIAAAFRRGSLSA